MGFRLWQSTRHHRPQAFDRHLQWSFTWWNNKPQAFEFEREDLLWRFAICHAKTIHSLRNISPLCSFTRTHIGLLALPPMIKKNLMTIWKQSSPNSLQFNYVQSPGTLFDVRALTTLWSKSWYKSLFLVFHRPQRTCRKTLSNSGDFDGIYASLGG